MLAWFYLSPPSSIIPSPEWTGATPAAAYPTHQVPYFYFSTRTIMLLPALLYYIQRIYQLCRLYTLQQLFYDRTRAN
jgi:hypothetical protein